MGSNRTDDPLSGIYPAFHTEDIRKGYTWDNTACFAHVTDYDLTLLKAHNGHVTGPVVDYMLQNELKKEWRKKRSWGSSPNETLIVSHNFWDLIENPDVDWPERSPEYTPSLEFHGHEDNPWFYKRIMFPCYLNHSHWCLLVWEFNHREGRIQRALGKKVSERHQLKDKWYPTVQVYDSMHTSRDYVWQMIANYFFINTDVKTREFVKKARPLGPISAPRDKVPTQRDDHNCGVYVIHMATFIIQGKNPKEKYHVPSKDVEEFVNVKYRLFKKRQRIVDEII
jgi:hypothetical protein